MVSGSRFLPLKTIPSAKALVHILNSHLSSCSRHLNDLSAFGLFIIYPFAILDFVKHRSEYVPSLFKNISRDFSHFHPAFRIKWKLCSVIFKILCSATEIYLFSLYSCHYPVFRLHPDCPCSPHLQDLSPLFLPVPLLRITLSSLFMRFCLFLSNPAHVRPLPKEQN